MLVIYYFIKTVIRNSLFFNLAKKNFGGKIFFIFFLPRKKKRLQKTPTTLTTANSAMLAIKAFKKSILINPRV